jgi:CO/xanthine dehydrogenase Mo-binding subunit
MTETVVAPERVAVEAPAEPAPWKGQSIPRNEDRRLVQGQGVFVDDIKRHNMGFAHYVRSPYAHASSVDRRLEALELPGVSARDERGGRDLTDPLQLDAARLGDQGLRAGPRPRAFIATSRDRRRGDARAGARRRDLVEVDYEPLGVLVVPAARFDETRQSPSGRRSNYSSGRASDGELAGRGFQADRIVKISSSTRPLHSTRSSATARCRVQPRHGAMDDPLQQPVPGFAAIMMAPAIRCGIDKLRFVTQDIGGGFGNEITSHPQLVACCLLARKLNRAIQ